MLDQYIWLQEFLTVHNVIDIKGDFAEVGVAVGGSAKVIADFVFNDKMLYLFDTFEGMPYHDEEKDNFHRKGDFSKCHIQIVENLLRNYQDNVSIIKGIFPQTASFMPASTFCFVNIDVDVYQSTRDCLEFFYPKMAKGGFIIILDDYGHPHCDGTRLAADEFIKDKPETWQFYNCIAYIEKA